MPQTQGKRRITLKDYLFARAGSMRVPLSGTFELSPLCNLSCRMCYIRKSKEEIRESARPMLTLSEWLKIAEDMKKEGTLFLLLTGGEPFLWPDFWELYEKLHDMGFFLTINTNGTMIDESAVERLKKRSPVRLNITLYGANDETYFRLCGVHGVYERVIRAVDMLKAAGIPMRINGSITPGNAGDIDQMLAFIKDRNLPYQSTTYMFPPVRRDGKEKPPETFRFDPEDAAKYQLYIYRKQFDRDAYGAYLKSILDGKAPPAGLDPSCEDPLDGKVRCRAGTSSWWITWDGYMLMCGMVPGMKSDIRDKGFSGAWKEVTEMTANLSISGTCAHCEHLKICHSCPAMASAETGTPSGIPRYRCRMVQTMKEIAESELRRGGEAC